jgi:hypothetical protein
MAGLDPAIHVFASHCTTGYGCVDARIKSGHDEWLVLGTNRLS